MNTNSQEAAKQVGEQLRKAGDQHIRKGLVRLPKGFFQVMNLELQIPRVISTLMESAQATRLFQVYIS